MSGHGFNNQIAAYDAARGLKQHEIEMVQLLKNHRFSSVLDIGCADAKFLEQVSNEFSPQILHGVELDSKLANLGNQRLEGLGQVFCCSAADYHPTRKYDCLVASGMLSIFHEPLEVLDQWLSWLNPGGRLFVFGRFNSSPVDTQVLFRNNLDRSPSWQGGLSAFSIDTVLKHLDSVGRTTDVKKFFYSGTISTSENPIRTWTLSLLDGSQIMVNGANIIAEHYFLVVE